MTANLVNPYSRNMFGPTFLKSGRGAGAAPLQKKRPDKLEFAMELNSNFDIANFSNLVL